MNRRFKAGVSIIAYRYLIKYILTPFKSLYLDISKEICTFASVKQINKDYDKDNSNNQMAKGYYLASLDKGM